MQGSINPPVWDLSALGDAKRHLADAEARIEQFGRSYADVAGLDAAGLAEAMGRIDEIEERLTRAHACVALRLVTAQRDQELQALRQHVADRADRVHEALAPFWNLWCSIKPERAEALLEDDRLTAHAGSLREVRRRGWRTERLRYLEYSLTVSGDPWHMLWEDSVAEMEEQLAPEAIDWRLRSPDPSVRRAAADRLAAAHEDGLETRARAFVALMRYRQQVDHVWNQPHWLAARNHACGVSDETVEAMLEAVGSHVEYARRWFRLRRVLCGVPTLAYYDLRAPLAGLDETESSISWATATEIVLESFALLSPRLADHVRTLLAARRIDAVSRVGKVARGFCFWTVPEVGPYVTLSYDGLLNDVVTLGHELGHAVHAMVAKSQGTAGYDASSLIHELVGEVGAKVVLERVHERATTPSARLRALVAQADESVHVIFHWWALHAFERRARAALRAEGYLSASDLNELWVGAHQDLYGDTVELSPGFEYRWSSKTHLGSRLPGYAYSYVGAQLMALIAQQERKADPDAFASRFLELLAAGSSRPVRDLGRSVGIDVEDPQTWRHALHLFDAQIDAVVVAFAPAIAGALH